ncbi:MAG: PKD domain-containing protein, partial [Gammaproteobacteria bacterium]|nr:PKD domain-containing protein [Gammaproteobacteria bacterium]
VGGIVYDVSFCSQTSAAHYGDPPIFDFGTSAEAKTAVEAVNAILNAEGGVKTVGNPGCPGNPPLGPIFRVGFDAVELNIPIPFFGEITIRLTKVWESVTGDNPPEQGVWVIPEDWDVFPFLDDGIFANFTAVDSTSSGNMPPSADAGAPILGEVGVEVGFDGSGSGDTDGTIVAYNWIFGDGNTGTGPTVSHTYVVADIYNVILEVTDDSGKTASDSTVAIIGLLGQGNLPPEADAGASASGVVGAEVSFDGAGSNDPDGTIVAYIWDFGDGNSGTGPTASHTYSTAGKYNVTLMVIDDAGTTDSDGTSAEIQAQEE